MDTKKDFIVLIANRACGHTWRKELDCHEATMNSWAIIKDSNKFGGTISFWLLDDEDREVLYKIGPRSIENAVEKICNDPLVSLPDEENEMRILYANKYNDVDYLNDDCINHIIQLASLGGFLD